MTIEIGKSNVPATEIKTVKTGKDITIKKKSKITKNKRTCDWIMIANKCEVFCSAVGHDVTACHPLKLAVITATMGIFEVESIL